MGTEIKCTTCGKDCHCWENPEHPCGHPPKEDQIQDLREKLKAEKLQNEELVQRIYKIGLLCDQVPGLEHGFCPDIGEPRDNVTRIKIALERFLKSG